MSQAAALDATSLRLTVVLGSARTAFDGHDLRDSQSLPAPPLRAMIHPMVVSLRNPRFLALAGLVALSAGAAQAADYVVVASTDPAIARGQAYDGGARLALAAGRTVTVMHAAGNVLTLRGATGGVLLPRREASPDQTSRLATLRFIVSSSERQVVARGGRTRGGICPLPEALTTLDDIRDAAANACADSASQAFEAWLKTAPRDDPPES